MIGIREHIDPPDWAILERLAKECLKAGGRAYLVGGSVRSALLDEKVVDCDVEVFGIRPRDLEFILQTIAKFTSVGKSFGIYKLLGYNIDVGLPRVEAKSGSGHRGFDVDIQPDLSLEDAASRRDFTINAMYFDILNGSIEDPMGGQKDLESRKLRHCSPRFMEDPLRVLRAMQFASRIPAEVAPETIQLSSMLTPESLSSERFSAEWEKLILKGKLPSSGLRFLQESGWIKYFPALHALVDCPQDSQWHPEGDVWEHTLCCMDAFSKYRTGNREDDLIVGLAVLCHDMGKPGTTEMINGRLRSYGHESAGLKPARKFMNQLKVAKRIVEAVLPLIKCHMRPAMLYDSGSSPNAIRRLARDCGRLDLLLRVFQADSMGRPPYPDNSAEAIEWIKNESERMSVGQSGPKPLIRGRDLLEKGWQSGPKMGVFLQDAYEAQLDGAFTNEEEAESWLKKKLD